MRSFILPLTLAACLAAHARQQQTDTIHLHDMVVTATRIPDDILPPQTLRGARLDALRSHSVADAIRHFGGVQLKDYGGIGGVKTVDIRSMGAAHTGVFFNGVQLGNAQNGQVDLGKYSLDNIESVSLYNGPRTDILRTAREYGNAGAVYLQTRIPRFDAGRRYNLRVAARTGSFDYYSPAVLFEYSLRPNMSLSVNGEWVRASGRYKFRRRRLTPSGAVAYDTTATRRNGDINAFRLEGALHAVAGPVRWQAIAYHYNSRRGIPGAIVNNVWHRGERLADRNTFGQAMAQYSVSPRWEMKIHAKYAYDYTHYVNNDDRTIPVDNTYRQHEAYASVANRIAITDRWEASAAYDIQYNAMSDYLTARRTTHWLSAATVVNPLPGLDMQASALATYVDEGRTPRGAADDKFKFTPALYLGYRPLADTGPSISVFAKKSYRMPTFNDLYYTETSNAALRPESASQYGLSPQWTLADALPHLRRLSLACDIYYNRVRDKIVAYPKGVQFRWTMLNLGRVDIRGLDARAEAGIALPAGVELGLAARYTFQRAIDITDPSDTYYRHMIPYVPRHSATANVQAQWRQWSLNIAFLYTGRRYSQQENTPYNAMPPWHTTDLSLMKRWTLRRTTLEATAEINNILNRQYDVILNYPMPGRNCRFTVAVAI